MDGSTGELVFKWRRILGPMVGHERSEFVLSRFMVSIIHQLSYKQIFHVMPLHSSGSGADLSNTTAPFPFPGDPGNPVLDYPEGCVLSYSPVCCYALGDPCGPSDTTQRYPAQVATSPLAGPKPMELVLLSTHRCTKVGSVSVASVQVERQISILITLLTRFTTVRSSSIRQ